MLKSGFLCIVWHITRIISAVLSPAQVEGADFRFQERMRGVVEYMQYREMPAEIKRKVRYCCYPVHRC